MNKKVGVIRTEACFLDDKKYRLSLYKNWYEEQTDEEQTNEERTIVFIGLNPSYADEFKLDTTIMNTTNYALENGYSSAYYLNLYPYVETDATKLPQYKNDYVEENLTEIKRILSINKDVVVIWGRDAELNNKRKIEVVKNIFAEKSCEVRCFKDNNGNEHCHPSRGFTSKWTLVDYN